MTTLLDKPEFNEGQTAALASMQEFLNSGQSFFVLRGPAGTGKTYTIKGLLRQIKGRVLLTAPTNKATKVLRTAMRRPDGAQPECKTIYSALGLKMEANGEIKQLSNPDPDDITDLSVYRLIVIDEGSMIPMQLWRHIEEAAIAWGVQFIIMGDQFQLPPVNEKKSPVWTIDCQQAELWEVMRHDNQILTLVTGFRKIIDHPAPPIRIVTDFDDHGGVRKCTATSFEEEVNLAIDNGLFTKPEQAKIIAWRNVTVDTYNRYVRRRLYGPDTPFWVEGDRLITTAPAHDLDDKPIAFTDDEGTVTRVTIQSHPIHEEFQVWRINVTFDDNRLATLFSIHPNSERAYKERVEELAQSAKHNGRLWQKYWEFRESFHSVRHAYAITSHRSQGSTYHTAFVLLNDIMVNRDKPEAMRSLYVACSRPTTNLFLL